MGKDNAKKAKDKKELLFYEDNKTVLVRELRQERKDYDALARCYNSFKDSDSWPGGFGGSYVFNGEDIEKRFKVRDHNGQLIITAPDAADTIVGVSLCCRTWNLPDSWYVQLLGVDPQYQGQKFGKALLLESTKFAMERSARFISLHTWGGNLKAMPLYKRQGYKWRPNTSVYMENYIPQILNFPYFQDLFSQFSWYDSFKPVINQVPDDEFEEKMSVYNYSFEMDENNSLEIWVDRSIGWISGFHKKTESEDIVVKAFTANTEVFIGIEDFSIKLVLQNNGPSAKEFAIQVSPTSQFVLKGKVPNSVIVNPKEEKEIEFKATIAHGTDEFNMDIQTHSYCEHQIVFTITCDGIDFPIKVGKAPLNAIKILTNPLNFATIPNHEFILPLEITNYLNEDKEIILELEDGAFTTFDKHKFATKVSTYDSSINIPAKTSATNTTLDSIKVSAKTKTGELLFENILPIMIFKEDKTLVYELEQKTFIENKYYRIYFYKKPIIGTNEVFIRDKLRNLSLMGNAIILGYPFDEEGGEFFSKELTHEIIEVIDGVWLNSTGSSSDKIGMRVTRKVFIPHSNQPIGFKFSLENTTDKSLTDLGILVGSYWWPGQARIKQIVIPHTEGILKYNLAEIPVVIDVESNVLTEGWKAVEYVSGTIGFLCDLERTEKFEINRTCPSFEYKIGKLSAKEKIDTPTTYYCFSDTWQSVRKIWQDTFLSSKNAEVKHYQFLKNMKNYGLINGNTISRGLIIDKNQKEIEIALKTIGKTTLKGSLAISLEENIITPTTFQMDNFTGKIWKEKVQLKASNNHMINGTISYTCDVRTFEKPIALGFFDSKKKVSVKKKQQEGKEVFEVDNGFLRFKGSKDHAGNLFYLAVEDDHNYLNTSFPEAKPFLWFSKFYGGIGTLVHPYKAWIGIEKYHETVSFESFEVTKGQWKGIGFASNLLIHTPTLKGIQTKMHYLTLPDSPFILLQHILFNNSETTRKLEAQTHAALTTTKSNKDKYFAPDTNGNLMTYNTHVHSSSISSHIMPYNENVAHKNPNNKYFFAVICPRDLYADTVNAYSPNFSYVSLGRYSSEITIKPQETIVLNTLHLLATNLAAIEPFTESNILDLLESK